MTHFQDETIGFQQDYADKSHFEMEFVTLKKGIETKYFLTATFRTDVAGGPSQVLNS